MTTKTEKRTDYVFIDDREPAGVRALIFARTSNPGGTASDVESQVNQCLAFVTRMGWTLIHPDNPSAYVGAKTGMRQVIRPVLDKVMQMVGRHEVDVIVTLKPARIARKKGTRYWAIETARKLGVEFRFAARAATNGKYPGGVDELLEQLKEDLLDEHEAMEITDRLTPGKRARYEQGLPHGGANGPNYGWLPGERRYRNTKPMGMLTWVIDEEKAPWVRWLFDEVDRTDVADLSLRGLVRRIQDEGAPTATGHSNWSAKQVSSILRNGKYAGKGTNLRWRTKWGTYTEKESGRVYEDTTITQRRIGDYPIPLTAIPAIVTPEQFDRVQAKLDALKDQNNRGGPRRTDPAARSSLLDGGLVRCAHCKGAMTRYWSTRSGRRERPFYQCVKRSGAPHQPCAHHTIDAGYTDHFALRLLARSLTDPEKILELADAAGQKYEAAGLAAALAAATLEATTKDLARITAEQEDLRTALAALSRVAGTEASVANIREDMKRLVEERQVVEAERERAAPQRDHALERQAFLCQMFTVRHAIQEIVSTGDTFLVGPITGYREPHLVIGESVPLAKAAALLGLPEAEVPGYREVGWLNEGTEEEPEETVLVGIERADVVYSLLRRASRENLRRVLRELGVTVLVARPRSRAEWGLHGKTPLSDRVTLQIGDLSVRTDVTNVVNSS